MVEADLFSYNKCMNGWKDDKNDNRWRGVPDFLYFILYIYVLFFSLYLHESCTIQAL